MKNISRLSLLILSFALVFSACKKDKTDPVPQAPSIANVEIGHDNSKVAYRGHDIHLEADINAPGKVSEIQVTIHKADGNGWEFTQTYTSGYAGAINPTFHEHVDIPADAAPGEYYIHIIVTDELGQKTTFEEEHLQIEEDNTLPDVENLNAVVTGGKMHITAHINAPNGIAKVTVEVEDHGDWDDEFEFDTGDMIGKTSWDFDETIDVPGFNVNDPGAHIHFGVEDQKGNEVEPAFRFNP